MQKAVYLFGLFSLATALFAADPFVGTWKLDPAKSTGSKVPKELTVVTEENGDNLHSTVNSTAADGTKVSHTVDYPKTGGKGQISGDPEFDGISVKHPTAGTRDITYMKDGKALRRTHEVVASSGKSKMTTVTGLDVHGKPLASGSMKEVFEKQ